MGTSANNDKELFIRISDGDENAFADVYRAYVPQLLPFIKSLVRTDAAADEVIQETFLQLWISRDKLASINEPRAWIFRIASNICYSHLRRLMAEKKVMHKVATTDAADDEMQQQASAGELASLIRTAIDQMPPQRKKIFQLSRGENMTIPQIAEALNLSPNTVKNTLVTSLQVIRDFLKEHGYDLPIIIIATIYF